MPRINIEDLPVMRPMDKPQMQGIFGGEGPEDIQITRQPDGARQVLGLLSAGFGSPFDSYLDISFKQGSLEGPGSALGSVAPGSSANFGFAILSDIEVFFLLQAAQGDNR